MAGAFQASAFQSPGFQQDIPSGGYGGFGLTSTASERVKEKFAEEAQELPKKVVEAIEEAAVVPGKKHDREKALRREIKQLDLRYRRAYMEQVERLRTMILDEQLREAFAEQREAQRREDDAIVMMLLM